MVVGAIKKVAVTGFDNLLNVFLDSLCSVSFLLYNRVPLCFFNIVQLRFTTVTLGKVRLFGNPMP